VLRAAVADGRVQVLESAVHARESAPRPELGLLALLRGLSGGARLPDTPDRAGQDARTRIVWTIEHELPERRPRRSDAGDLDALAVALVACDIVTLDAFMADAVRRARLDVRHRCELYTGRRADVQRLCRRLARLG
jgi:hypothetical protein